MATDRLSVFEGRGFESLRFALTFLEFGCQTTNLDDKSLIMTEVNL